MEMKIVGVSVAVVVSLVVLAGVLMPVLEDATAKSDTIENEGYFKVSKLASTDEGTVTIQWDKATMSNYILVNDEKVTISFPPSTYGFSLIFGDNWDFRAYATTLGNAFNNVQFYRSIDGTNTVTAFTLTLTSGTYSLVATISGSQSTVTGSYTAMYYPSNDGALVMKKMDAPAHIFADTEIYAFGLTDIKGSDGTATRSNVGYVVSGSIDDGFTVSNWRVNTLAGDTLTHSDPVADYSTSAKWVDVLDLSKITFTTTATQDDASTDTNVVYSYFLVPAEITADRLDPLTDGEISLLDAIPMIIIAAVLIGVVALVIRSKLD